MSMNPLLINLDDDDNSSNASSQVASENHILAGVSLWIAADWPEYGLSAFENKITKCLMDANLDIQSCRAIKPRGKRLFQLYLW